MNKLISNPIECGIRGHVRNRGYSICNKTGNRCDNPDIFPTNCPLQEGKTHEQFIEDLKPNIIHVGYAGLPKKRRNRKDCQFGYTPNQKGIKILHCKHKGVSYPHCQGVCCGYFETKI